MSKRKGIIIAIITVLIIALAVGFMYRYFSYKQRKYLDLEEEWTLYLYDQWSKETSEIGTIKIDKDGYYDIHLEYNGQSCELSLVSGPKDCFDSEMTYDFGFSDDFDAVAITEFKGTKIKDIYVAVSEDSSFENNNANRLKVIDQNGFIGTDINWEG